MRTCCWLKIFFDPNVLFRALPPSLSRRGYAAPRATDQPVLRGKHPARSRSSEHSSVRTLCSVHHLAPGGSAPPSPLLTRSLFSVQPSFHVLPPGVAVVLCLPEHLMLSLIMTPWFLSLSLWHKPLSHPLLLASISTVLVIFYSSCQRALIEN